MAPFQDRNWPYDHSRTPDVVDMGVHTRPPIAKLPGIQTRYFLSPRLQSNDTGADGSDDRSWWQALVEADNSGRFPKVEGLITLSSPHHGSHMALMDDKIISFLSKVQKTVPTLPNDVGNEVIRMLKTKIDDYVGACGDEIELDSALFRALERQEPIRPGVRCISVGGTSPRLLRLYLWTFTGDSMIPKKSKSGKLEFHWMAKPVEAKGASPIPDGLPLKLLGMDLDEIMPGRGDGMTADKRCRFPSSFHAEEHISVRLSHAEELWDADLQRTIIKRLNTFK